MRVAAEEREKETSIPLRKDSDSQSKGKVIPASFLKVEGRGMLVGMKDQRERDSEKNG